MTEKGGSSLEKTDIKSLTQEELVSLVKDFGEPKFRAKQLFKWLQSGVENFDEMTNIPQTFRDKLNQNCYIAGVKIVRRLSSKLD